AILRMAKSLEEKEETIRELKNALDAYRAAFFIFAPFARAAVWITRPIFEMFGPKLGILRQYAPRRMEIPASYAQQALPEPKPRISIVTPSFRHAAFIERTVASVLEQGYPNLEYFVQDGASEDGTREILERYSGRLAGWDSRPDNGQAHAINAGFVRS